MASLKASTRPVKPSFAKIAAAGLKNANVIQEQQKPSLPAEHSPSDMLLQEGQTSIHTNAPKLLAQPTIPGDTVEVNGKDGEEHALVSAQNPAVRIQSIENTDIQPRPVPDGFLMPSTSDDAGTLLSSSDRDGQPQSLDGKSVASATTFALDEKESLRPDDSASVQAAAEDEDVLSPHGSGLPESHIGSDADVRAFREQLNEISSMEPSSRQPILAANTQGASPAGVLYVPPQGPGTGPIPGAPRHPILSDAGDLLPDQKLLEALDNPRDRIWVLKLEQDVIDFVKDAKESSLNLPQCNSFYRMLAHKIADYYMLGHLVDDSNSNVRLFKTPNCRIPRPLTGVVTPSTAASTPPPNATQMKILRRGIDGARPPIANGSNLPSKNASEHSESGNDDDLKKPVTREEREARYEAARLRIMGSAKPSDLPEAVNQKDDSRSSSAAGKRTKKKPRADSDDGFEARSAYNSYIPTAYGPNGPLSPNPFGYPGTQGPQLSQYQQHQSYGGPDVQSFQQMPGQDVNAQNWGASAYSGAESPNTWSQGQQLGYDLSHEFDHAMSFQSSAPVQGQPQYGSGYYQQTYPGNSIWSQQSFTPSRQAPQPYIGMSPNFSDRPPSSASQTHSALSYAFGQLPSQALGRPPNALEHPLPGSYKSRHFNPQSQAFIPGHANGNTFRPFAPQRALSGPNTAGYGTTAGLEHQLSSQSQNSNFGSPSHGQGAVLNPRLPQQPLTHPLPQPVFPSQPSPSVPLPPKPVTSQQMGLDTTKLSMQGLNSNSPNHSTIAKWGAPASLPAKPPPAAETFENGKFPSTQRTSTFNILPTMPRFGSMPPVTGEPTVHDQSTSSPVQRN